MQLQIQLIQEHRVIAFDGTVFARSTKESGDHREPPGGGSTYPPSVLAICTTAASFAGPVARLTSFFGEPAIQLRQTALKCSPAAGCASIPVSMKVRGYVVWFAG